LSLHETEGDLDVHVTHETKTSLPMTLAVAAQGMHHRRVAQQRGGLQATAAASNGSNVSRRAATDSARAPGLGPAGTRAVTGRPSPGPTTATSTVTRASHTGTGRPRLSISVVTVRDGVSPK
jgi:hypothetical protein